MKSLLAIRNIVPYLSLVLWLLTVAVVAWGHQEDGQALRELDVLLARAESVRAPCEGFLSKIRDPEWAVSHGPNPSYASAASARAALAVMETYPGLLPGDAAVADYFADHAAELSRNWYQGALHARLDRSRGNCATVDVYNNGQALMAEVRARRFSPWDQARVQRLVRRLLLANPRFFGLVDAEIKGELLVDYLKTFPEGASKDLRARAEALKAQGLQADHAVMASPRGGENLRNFEFEHRAVDQLFRSYYGVIRDGLMQI